MGTINSVVLTDACFSYSIDIMKSFMNLNMGYELNLDFAVPYSYPFALVICSVIALVLAYLADSYVGKYHLTVIGLFFSFMSGLFCNFYFTDLGKTAKDILMLSSMFSLLIYVVTSPIRNVILLEQVKFKLVYLRRYIFYLVYARLVARGFSCVVINTEPQELISLMTCTLAFLGILIYFVLFPCCLGAMFMFESIYYGISNKCAACFCRALGRLIYQDKTAKKPSVGGHRVHFADTNNCQLKLNRCLHLTSGEKFCTDSGLTTRHNLQHWLSKARPQNNEFEVSQTYEAYKILPFLIFGVAFTYLNYFITELTVLQNAIVKKNSFQILDKIDIIFLIIIIKLLLFPIVEFGLFPFFSRFLKRDTYIFVIGYAILTLSLCMAIFCQQIMLNKLVYIPTDGLLQIRVFNSIGKEIYIKSSVQNYTVPKYGYKLLKDVVYNDKSDSIYISKKNSKEDFKTLHFNVSSVPVVSVLVTEENISLSNNVPTLYHRINGDLESLIYVVVPPGLTAKCTFTDPIHGVTFSNIATKDRNVISVRPGEYMIAVDVESFGSHNSSQLVSIESDLYAVFPFKRENVANVSVYVLEKAIWITYVYLLPQIVTLCLGNTVATISFLRFIYLESPQKLRCSVFAFLFALNNLLISSHSIIGLNDITSSLTMLVLSVCAILFCLSASLWFPYQSGPYLVQ